MVRLSLSLLGTFQVTLHGQPVTGFESNRVRALLAYLAVEADHPHSRDRLAGLLWPEQPDKTAHNNFRGAIANLRRVIGDHAASPPFLHIARDHVQFNTASDYHLDVASFVKLLAACEEHVHRNPETCKVCMQWLQDAASVYRGDFLEHFFPSGVEAFEEWVLLQRERLHRLAVDALYRLADFHERRGTYEQAQRYAARQLELDPWREEAHRQLMRVLALSGQRTAALAQYEKCRRILADELGAEPTPDTIALYQQIKSGSLKVGQSASSLQPPNLPTPTTRFVGREEELAHISALLADPGCRLLTLAGPGGAGKTRLALAVAAEQTGCFTHGVRFVSLAALSSTEFLVSAIADALGVALYGPADPKAQLLSYLREKDMLIVLDGFEHLVSGTILLAEIIQHSPRVDLLVTSRVRLGLHAEWVFDVQGLRYPEVKVKSTESLETYDAARLFLQRAHMIQADFSLSQANECDIARICRMIEGMPLAIEIATAWLPFLSCHEIAQEIERNLDFLATHQPDIPSRHRSMRAVIDRSWNLLSDDEQSVFRSLSVFRGGFSKEAAGRVADAPLLLLSALVNKSMVRRTPAGRYEMHELARQYAQEKLREDARVNDSARDRHGRFFMEFLQYWLDRVKGPQQAQAIGEIGVEIENVRAAWRWAVRQRKIADVRKALKGLWYFFDIRGWFHEANLVYTWTTEELSAGNSIAPDDETSIALWCSIAQQGFFLIRLGRYSEAKRLLHNSLAALPRMGARAEVSDTLHYLGVLNWLMGDYREAQRSLEEGITIDGEIHDRWGVALKLGTLGLVVQAMGEYVQAKQLLLKVVAIFREIGDPRMIAVGLIFLGPILCALGETLEAQRLLREGLAISRGIGDQWGTPICLNHLGLVTYMKGDYAEAKQYHLESLALFKEIGDRGQVAVSLCHLGNTSYALNDYQESKDYFYDALQLARDVQAVPVALTALCGLAVLLAQGATTQREQACELLGLVISHPASPKETKDRAEHLLITLESGLPLETVAAVKERVVRLSLQEIVDGILSEM